ncbi:CU044_2847 family protein [Nocardiopsis aegyptia]|uniref:CU044_2847 family protein n=1 Tax=Nocardiopsis aegyptia TaxID=220378 RepID=UPI00367326A6
MSQLVRFRLDDSEDAETVVIEVEDGDSSVPVGGGGIAEATETFTEKLASVRKAVSVTLEELGDTLKPQTINVTFGVKLKSEAGAVIAKSSVEGNLQVEMEWKREAESGGG